MRYSCWHGSLCVKGLGITARPTCHPEYGCCSPLISNFVHNFYSNDGFWHFQTNKDPVVDYIIWCQEKWKCSHSPTPRMPQGDSVLPFLRLWVCMYYNYTHFHLTVGCEIIGLLNSPYFDQNCHGFSSRMFLVWGAGLSCLISVRPKAGPSNALPLSLPGCPVFPNVFCRRIPNCRPQHFQLSQRCCWI